MGQTLCSIASSRTFRCLNLRVSHALRYYKRRCLAQLYSGLTALSLFLDRSLTHPYTHSGTLRRSYTDLHAVMAAWQAEDESLQARALQALQGFAKGKRGGVSMPMQAMQEAFQGCHTQIGIGESAQGNNFWSRGCTCSHDQEPYQRQVPSHHQNADLAACLSPVRCPSAATRTLTDIAVK